MPSTIVHIGAGKCGSSSIQSFFSQHPFHCCLETKKEIEYCCFSQKGLLRGQVIPQLLAGSIQGYIASQPRVPGEALRTIIDRLSSISTDVLLSCEGWLNQLLNPQRAQQLAKTWSGNGSRDIILYLFVRPPVSWINSAWWQWGAWDKDIVFSQWVNGMTNAAQWGKHYQRLKGYGIFKHIEIQVLGSNVVHQLADSLGIERSLSMESRSNISLPSELLQLFTSHKHFRQDVHDPKSDFVAMRALSRSNFNYTKAPFVLTSEQVSQILEATRESADILQELISNESRLAMLANPAWWSADFYPKEPSTLSLTSSTLNYEQLSVDLLNELVQAYGVLAKHKLLGQS
jgi:hypothetical protein